MDVNNKGIFIQSNSIQKPPHQTKRSKADKTNTIKNAALKALKKLDLSKSGSRLRSTIKSRKGKEQIGMKKTDTTKKRSVSEEEYAKAYMKEYHKNELKDILMMTKRNVQKERMETILDLIELSKIPKKDETQKLDDYLNKLILEISEDTKGLSEDKIKNLNTGILLIKKVRAARSKKSEEMSTQHSLPKEFSLPSSLTDKAKILRPKTTESPSPDDSSKETKVEPQEQEKQLQLTASSVGQVAERLTFEELAGPHTLPLPEESLLSPPLNGRAKLQQ